MWLDAKNRLAVVGAVSAGNGKPGGASETSTTHSATSVAPLVEDAVDRFRERHPEWAVSENATFLSGISDIAQNSTQAVLAVVRPSDVQIGRAVRGLREAAGRDARIVLCCGPEGEPSARAALAGGADDYVVWPADVAEMESALGLAPAVTAEQTPSGSAVEEIERLSDAVGWIDQRPAELLQKLAELVRRSVGASGISIALQGAGATAGEPVRRAVLAFPMEPPMARGAAEGWPRVAVATGQLVVGEKQHGPYTASDIDRLMHYAKLIRQLVEAAATQRHWKEMALTDSGSGLLNRRYLQEHLPGILERAGREQFAVTLLLFDVDDFKSFNDAHGHDAGDEILRVVGQLFRKTCREQDIVTRYGGDEFAVVFWDPGGPREPGSRHPQQALSVVDRFTEALRAQHFSRLGPGGGRVTISGGLATFPWDATNMETLVSRADQALLSAKRAGKNRVVVVGG